MRHRLPLARFGAALLISTLFATLFVVSAPQASAQDDAPENCSAAFVDVPEESFFTRAVEWAACHEITTGTSTTTFSPDALVSRGQMATFLWRFANKPAGADHTFSDVPTGVYFSDPVRWLAQSGITTGTSDTTFSPHAPVTRGQIATFLWRLAGEPASALSNFADVSSSAYYAVPVGWLSATGITTGTSDTTFSPDNPLTRAEAVTFMWRLAHNEDLAETPEWAPGAVLEVQQVRLRSFTIAWSEFAGSLQRPERLELTLTSDGVSRRTDLFPRSPGTTDVVQFGVGDLQPETEYVLSLVAVNEAGDSSPLTATVEMPRFVFETEVDTTVPPPAAAGLARSGDNFAAMAPGDCVTFNFDDFMGITKGRILKKTRLLARFSKFIEVCRRDGEIYSVNTTTEGFCRNLYANPDLPQLSDEENDKRRGEGTRDIAVTNYGTSVISSSPTKWVISNSCDVQGEAALEFFDPFGQNFEYVGRTFIWEQTITLEDDGSVVVDIVRRSIENEIS